MNRLTTVGLILFTCMTASLGVASLVSLQAETAAKDAHFCSASEGNNDRDYIDNLKKKCRVGDVIHIHRASITVVEILCDFSRSVVVPGNSVMCVIGPERPRR